MGGRSRPAVTRALPSPYARGAYNWAHAFSRRRRRPPHRRCRHRPSRRVSGAGSIRTGIPLSALGRVLHIPVSMEAPELVLGRRDRNSPRDAHQGEHSADLRQQDDVGDRAAASTGRDGGLVGRRRRPWRYVGRLGQAPSDHPHRRPACTQRSLRAELAELAYNRLRQERRCDDHRGSVPSRGGQLLPSESLRARASVRG